MQTLMRTNWPTLNKLFELGSLPYEAYALADSMLGPYQSEAAAAFICHLMLAAQKGHLCIEVDNTSLRPAPQDTWLSENGKILANEFTQLILQGVLEYPNDLSTDDQTKPICRFGDFFYLQKYWQQEKGWIDCLKRALTSSEPVSFDHLGIQQEAAALLNSKKLLPEQANAILEASKHSLVLICGGPGTGKTYTAGLLIKTLLNYLPEKNKEQFRISLAAPTGKAAANLQNSLNKALGTIQNYKIDKAKTLHALLEINPRQKYQKRTYSPLAADLILVDECSMIDLNLMTRLFMALKPGARMILLGDHHQLPAVGIGSPFAHLKAYLQSLPEHASKVCEFKTCLRSDLKGILDFASAIKEGNSKEALNLLRHSIQGVECLFMEENQSLTVLYNRFVEKTVPYFSYHTSSFHPETLFSLFNQFRILSPLRKGPLGIETLNQLLFNELIKKAPDNSSFAAPILLTKNDYKLELFNGEIGVLIKHRKEGLHPGDYALFPSKESGEPFRKIPALLLPQFEYAYCLSVHKSQGSEFENVLLMLPPGSETFGREVLYTAVTRAQKHLQLWTTQETLIQTIQRSSQRVSGFFQRMKS